MLGLPYRLVINNIYLYPAPPYAGYTQPAAPPTLNQAGYPAEFPGYADADADLPANAAMPPRFANQRIAQPAYNFQNSGANQGGGPQPTGPYAPLDQQQPHQYHQEQQPHQYHQEQQPQYYHHHQYQYQQPYRQQQHQVYHHEQQQHYHQGQLCHRPHPWHHQPRPRLVPDPAEERRNLGVMSTTTYGHRCYRSFQHPDSHPQPRH
ncbi:hypothetical protein BGX33_002736 [Mortierella sp. NVP41]|nr:hypothetical protein BGX33_002736 [Mortierella sp. NVP41]